jgi:NAD(P)-dependent dehydrogenase (short-subunit alcohol dehydrogenase family)
MAARKVIVTGGFGALGRVVAAAFVARGDQVARVDVSAAPAETLAGVLDLGGVDLTDAAGVGVAVARASQAFGGLDTLVNIAGGFTFETLDDGGVETWNVMHARNLVTNATMTKAALPALKQSQDARIINIGAAAALQAGAGMGAYAASKAGVHRLTESLAAEMAGEDVTVNAILPSIIDTPANRADMPKADFSQWVPPQAIADVILFLASPASRAITGALIPITRGAPKAKR